MATIKVEELRNALEFVSADAFGDEEAYVCLTSGIIYWLSSEIDQDQDMPQDIETSDLYIAIPHKKELGLGQDMVMSFIGQELPEDYNTVASYFRKKGAYRRFKDLLALRGQLDAWYAFENSARDQALLAWCKENGIELSC